MSKVLDFSALEDEPIPDVTVKLNFDPIERGEQTAQTWRDLQRAKFPTNEELGGVPGSIKEAQKPWSIYEVGKTALEDLNPLNLIRPFSRPVETAEALGRAREHSEQKVGEAINDARHGDNLARAEAVTRGMLNVIPVVGPMIANAAEEGATDPSKLVGHGAAALIAPKLYGAASESTPTASAKQFIDKLREGGVRGSVADAVNTARGIDPASSLFRALRPRNFVRNADERLKAVMPEVNAGAELTGAKPVDIKTLNDAVEAQIDARLKEQKALIGPEKFAISGKPIADKILGQVPKLERLKMGDEAWAGLQNAVMDTWDRNFTPQELGEYLKDSNASRSVQGYFAKLPGQQIALDRVLDKAMAMAENGGIRETLVNGLENFKGTGEGLKRVNGALRDLITTKDLLDRRYNVELRQAVENLPQQVSKLAAMGRYGAAAKAFLAGSPGMGALDILTGLGEQGITDFIKELNSTNGQIASAFRRFKDMPGATPLNPVSRYQRALMPSSSAVEPQTETGSASPGSLSAQYQWQRPRAIASPQGLRDDYDTFMQTGVGNTTQRMRDMLNAPALSSRVDLARRMTPDVFNRPAAVPGEPIDAEIVSQTPRPDFHMPAADTPAQKLLPQGSGQQAGKTVRPMPESPLTSREFLNLQDAEYEIQRDPKTGRFKKVYKNTGTGKLTREKK